MQYNVIMVFDLLSVLKFGVPYIMILSSKYSD